MLPKKKELTWGLSLLTAASALCLAGLRAVDKRLAEKKEREKK